jgi:hypothetical protein
MSLVIIPFAIAVDRLREGLRRYERDRTDEQIRDGLIQRFEFTYELSHKILKRYLEQTAASPEELDQMPFQDLVRTGRSVSTRRRSWPRRSAKEISPSRWTSPIGTASRTGSCASSNPNASS